jgi:AcrR family transcriptional regulator
LSPGSGPSQEAELRVDARRNQQRILLAAARLLADDPAVSVQRIADEAQVARLTVHRRYPSRDALVDAILGAAVAEFGEALQEGESSSADAADAIAHLIRSLARIGAKYPILLQVGGTPGGRASPHESGQTDHDTTAIVERFDAVIARGQADGTVRPDLAPEVLRFSLFGALAMSLRLARARTEDRPPTAQEVGTQVADIIVDGLRPRAAGAG